MRSTATILLLALSCLKAEAELRFTDPQPFPDIGLEMPTFFAASPDGVSMPHTESFLVTESDGSRRLEDRYDTFDLWSARTVRARWRDENGNLLVVARLASAPPDDPPETLSTRSDFESRLTALAIKPKDAAARNAAVVACAIPRRKPRFRIRAIRRLLPRPRPRPSRSLILRRFIPNSQFSILNSQFLRIHPPQARLRLERRQLRGLALNREWRRRDSGRSRAAVA